MATNDPYGNQNWAQQPPYPPPPRQGMSSGTKVVLILLAVFGGLALLCCGGVVGTMVYFGKQFANAVSDDPQVVRQVTQQLIQIEIPEALKPVMSFDMKIPVANQRMTWLVYADRGTNSSLILTAFGEGMGDVNHEQMRQQMEQSLRQQGINPRPEQPGNWQSQSSPKEIEIRGQKVTFQFTKHTDSKNRRARLDVTGTIPDDKSPVVLLLSADANVVNEEQAAKMLESIK